MAILKAKASFERSLIIALPGFLGKKEDWHQFCFDDARFIPMNLIEAESFQNFAKKFNSQIEQIAMPRILMGYSLGARLAMHAVLDRPEYWSKAIFISGHPGLSSQEEKETRKRQDAIWADEFKSQPWKNVIAKWEAQAVFKSSRHCFKRQECEYSRAQLAHCLTTYSLGLQENLKEKLSQLELPILWITGQKDEKFSKIAESIVLKNKCSKKIAIAAGHRVPWECPEDFQKAIYRFLKDS